MKTSLKLLALLASLSTQTQASITDYNGDRIYNQDDAVTGGYTGTIRVVDTWVTSSSYDGQSGAIRLDQTGITTSLTGDISLTGSSSGDYGYGIRVSDGLINLATSSSSDQIVINTSGRNAVGVISNMGSLTVTANAGGRLQEFRINATGSGADGMDISNGSTLYINAATIIDAGDAGMDVSSSTDITLLGTLDITAGSYGIYTSGYWSAFTEPETIIDLSGLSTTKISSNWEAVCAQGNSKVILGRDLEASHTDAAGTYSCIVSASDGGRVEGTGKYSLKGEISSDTNSLQTDWETGEILGRGSTVDLTFTYGSVFDGYTSMRTNDEYKGIADSNITLAFEAGATWLNTDASALNELTVEAGGSIEFSREYDWSDLQTEISLESVFLEAGAILKIDVDGSLVRLGEQFTLFTGLDGSWDNWDRDSITGEFLFENVNATFDNGGFYHNATLMSADGLWQFCYTNPAPGVFEISCIKNLGIPEPATATLGLLGLASLLVRRRRQV